MLYDKKLTFSLCIIFNLAMESLEMFIRTTWIRSYFLLLSMIFIMMMVTLKWWSDSDDDRHNSKCVIRNSRKKLTTEVATSDLFLDELFALFCNKALAKKKMCFICLKLVTFLCWLKGGLLTKSIQKDVAQVSPHSKKLLRTTQVILCVGLPWFKDLWKFSLSRTFCFPRF